MRPAKTYTAYFVAQEFVASQRAWQSMKLVVIWYLRTQLVAEGLLGNFEIDGIPILPICICDERVFELYLVLFVWLAVFDEL